MTKLLAAVEATHYVVSTNNDHFDHPNDEALARVVLYGGDTSTLWFNYKTQQNLRWSNPAPQQEYKFATSFPNKLASGITLVCRPTGENGGNR